MKRREEELKNMKLTDEDQLALERRKMLEEQHRKLQEKRDNLHKSREDRIKKEEEKEKRRKELVSQEAFKKYHTKLKQKPDEAGLKQKDQARNLNAKKTEEDGESSDSDYDVN